MYPPQPPNTGIGSLQSDVRSLRSDINRKAESHEVHTLNSRLDSLEYSLREVRTLVDDYLYRMQAVEEAIGALKEERS